jgi:hypothetical protein
MNGRRDRYELIKEVCEKRKAAEQAEEEYEVETIYEEPFDPFAEMKEAGHKIKDFL